MINKNDRLELEVVDYDMEGFGICKMDNFVIFVPNVLRGELVDVLIVKVNKNFAFGKAVRILRESPCRNRAECGVYEKCGGCNLMHAKYQEQLEIKKHICFNTIKKISGIELKDLKIIPSVEKEYRNKVSVPFQMIEGKIQFGFYRNRSHDMVEIGECIVQNKANYDILNLIKNLLKEFKIEIYDENSRKGIFRHVILKNNSDETEYMVVLIAAKNVDAFKEMAKRLISKVEKIKSVVLNVNTREDNVILGEENLCLAGDGFIIDQIGDLRFKIGAQSFYQINRFQTKRLYDAALELADIKKSDVVVDAYCGIGTISLFLAQKCKFVYGLEINKEAVENAKDNQVLNDVKNVQFLLGDVEKTILKVVKSKKIDVIVLDPPRKGCSEEFIKTLIEAKIEKILYISCGEKGLAQNLKVLKEFYDVKDYVCVDMFPQTSHVETVCHLSLKTSQLVEIKK